MLIDHTEKIRHFLGVVRYGSIRKYSIKENISQSDVAKSMQILESVLDVDLFIRKRTGIELTQAGVELKKFGESLLEMVQDTESRIQKKRESRLTGRVKLGAYQSISVYFIPYLVEFIKKNQSQIILELFTGSSSGLVKDLKDKKINLCISVDPKPIKGMKQVELYEDYFSFYKHIKLLDQSDVFSFLGAKDQKGKTVADYLENLSKKYTKIPCGDFETVKALVTKGLGIGVLPNWVAKSLVSEGVLEKIKIPGFDLNFGPHKIVLSFDDDKDPSINWVAEQIKIMLGV